MSGAHITLLGPWLGDQLLPGACSSCRASEDLGITARHCHLSLVLSIKSSHLAKPQVGKVKRIILSWEEEGVVNKFGSARAVKKIKNKKK